MNDGLRHTPGRCGLAANPSLPADLLDRFIAGADAELCLDLAERADLSQGQVRALAARGGTATVVRLIRRRLLTKADVDAADPEIQLALLDEGDAPDEWVRSLATHEDSSVRSSVAATTGVPADVLATLAQDLNIEVVTEAARSSRLTARVAAMLAEHPHMAVRRAVATNEMSPPSLLAALADGATLPPARFCYGCDATDEPPPGMHCGGGHEGALVDLQYAIVANPSTPADVAEGFVDHPVTYVRWTLANRRDLSPEAYQRLANDPEPSVRGNVAANPAISERLIRRVARDTTDDVRRRLAGNPAIPLDVLTHIASTARIGATVLPRIAAATPGEVEQLSRSPVAAVRMALAERADLPASVVHLLAEDPDAKVLKALAPNPMLTNEQLRSMLAKHGGRVAARVAANPTCSPDLLRELATQGPPVQKAYRIVAAHPNADGPTLVRCLRDPQARPIAARHPALPVGVLAELVDDPDEGVAEAAAANPSLPRHAMEHLLSGQAERRAERQAN